MKGFSSKRTALTVDVLQDRTIYCLQARPCIFQPGHLTGWGSEGVKRAETTTLSSAAVFSLEKAIASETLRENRRRLNAVKTERDGCRVEHVASRSVPLVLQIDRREPSRSCSGKSVRNWRVCKDDGK